jgi:hypothetical protein
MEMSIFIAQRYRSECPCGTGNVALAGTQGGPEKYDMYLRYGAPPTAAKWDWKAEVHIWNLFTVNDILV